MNKNYNKLNPLSFSSNTSNITRNIRSNISIGTMTEKTYNSNSNNKLFFSNNNIDSTNDDFSERNSHRKDLSYAKSSIIPNKKKEFITNRDRENVIFENTNENFNLTKKSFRNENNEYLYNNNINNNNGNNNKNLPKIFYNNKVSNLNSNTNSLQVTKRTENNYTKTDKIYFSGSNTERERYEIFNPKITQQSNNFQNTMIRNNSNNNNNNNNNYNRNNDNYNNYNNNNFNNSNDDNNYYNYNNNNYDKKFQINNIESYENGNDNNKHNSRKQNRTNIITEKNSQSNDSVNRTKKKIGFQEEKNTYSKIDNYNKNSENESNSDNNESYSENYENDEEEEEEESKESISKKGVFHYILDKKEKKKK
jgi:hypothetical protein